MCVRWFSVIYYFSLTKREGRTGRILPEVVLVRIERSEVPTRKAEGDILPVRPRGSES